MLQRQKLLKSISAQVLNPNVKLSENAYRIVASAPNSVVEATALGRVSGNNYPPTMSCPASFFKGEAGRFSDGLYTRLEAQPEAVVINIAAIRKFFKKSFFIDDYKIFKKSFISYCFFFFRTTFFSISF